MKVHAYTRVHENRRPHSPDGERLEWQVSRFETLCAHEPEPFCCAEMQEAWGDLIGFGDKGSPLGNSSADVNIYEYYFESWHEHPIRFCPFCGDRIEVEKGAPSDAQP